MPYPYTRYINRMLPPEKQEAQEALHLKTAAAAFRRRAEDFAAAGAVLSLDEKRQLMPYMTMLARAGWPGGSAQDVIHGVAHDRKSMALSNAAFKSLPSFALKADDRNAVHIALHYIGGALNRAAQKYRADQARAPAGNAGGGRWVDEGRGRSAASGSSTINKKPRPASVLRSSPGPRAIPTDIRTPAGSRSVLRDLFGVKPASAMSNELPDKDPLEWEDMLESGGRRGGHSPAGPSSGNVGGGRRTSINPAPREQEYVDGARKLPVNVKQTGRGDSGLTSQQAKKLEKWKKENIVYKKNFDVDMEVTTYSDGRAIYTFKVPGKVPGSYRINEKHVSPSGETIRVYGVNIDHKGDFIGGAEKVKK